MGIVGSIPGVSALDHPAPVQASTVDVDTILSDLVRLLDERYQLDQLLLALKAGSVDLSLLASQGEYYRDLNESLVQRIVSLENLLAENERTMAVLNEALAAAATALDDSAALLDQTGQALDHAEWALDEAEADRIALSLALNNTSIELIDTQAYLDLLREELALAQQQAALLDGSGYLQGWSLDTSRFGTVIRKDLSGALVRMGTWRISGADAAQTDRNQFFSRLELPLAQDRRPLLYSFKARAGGDGWVGLGLHFYVEDVVKPRGYGEGKSLLVWFTRDRAVRGDDATYLQLYRSDDDIVMARMFDAELADSIDDWRYIDIVYDPVAEYVAVAVDGILRVAYKTFFDRQGGVSIALRTLGAGVEFADFRVLSQ
jgi:uncharacterized coiled-coil protein SlyX